MKKIFLVSISFFCFTNSYTQDLSKPVGEKINAFQFQEYKNIQFKKAAVASAHPLASWIGADIMKKGGNAFDAAIAVQWALAVVYPSAGNIGGGGFMVAQTSKGKQIALDYRESAPQKSSRDMYLDADGNPIVNKSLYGALAAGIPGSVAGIFATHQFAKLSMVQLIQPAIDLAEKGFVISAGEARSLNGLKKYFTDYNTVTPVFVKNIEWKAGDTLIQKDLAETLKRIRDKGSDGFYKGKTADLIVAEMQRSGGIISHADLIQYKAIFRKPFLFKYRDYEIVSMPMPSSGGLLLRQMLGMIEPFKISAWGFQSEKSMQLMIEAERRAFADRAKYMGDPDFNHIPIQLLASTPYLNNRMKNFSWSKASKSSDIQAGVIPGYESEETTHISIMDNEGNAVSVTTTLNNSYGSRTVVGGAGFILNDEMDDFSVKPGAPNLYGAVGGKVNAIAPGKRMLSSMTPTIVLKNKKLYSVIGTPGGTTIPTSVFQTIVNLIDFKMSAKEAVFAPKFHHPWLPDRVDVEKSVNKNVLEGLSKKGYTFFERSQIGRVEAIVKLSNGKLDAVADNRGDDSVAGF
ncbi:MAG: gamma-glutamyltransferase [Bacteroidia bacterium]|nr:MAG: gamma-glutamyltransferase [Bacteroidia bacterium]